MCYIELIIKESDNNIKLIVLDRLFSLKDNPAQEKILQDLVMDILRVLSSTDLEVRKKALKLVSELVTSRTVDEVRAVLVVCSQTGCLCLFVGLCTYVRTYVLKC